MSVLRKFKPHGYQKKTIKFFVERAAAGAFLDPGLGKTMITYCAFDVLREANLIDKLFIVTLLRPAYKVWPEEVRKWGLPFKVHILHGKGKNEKFLNDKSIDVFVINYEGLDWLSMQLKSAVIRKKLKRMMLAFDESSKLRNTNTQRFKIVREIIGYFVRRYILTGTPAPKGLMGLFGQIFVLDGGKRLGRYITHFRMLHCDKVQIGYDGPFVYSVKEEAEPIIHNKIKDVVIRFGEEELDNIPKLVVRDIHIDLPLKARTVYDDLKRDLITAIENRVIVAKNAGVATQKLRQVANGGLYFDEAAKRGKEREWTKLHDEKTDAVLELVEELEDKPVLIGYEFHHDLQRLRAALPKGTPCLTDVSMKQYEALERDWNRGNIPVALAQISSIAHGNNLQGSGAALIIHSFVWNYEDYDQFIKRVKRQGNKAKRAYVYRIVADRTVDEAVMVSWAKKGATQNDLFNALKRSLRT